MNFDFDDLVDAGNGIGNVLWIICGGLLFAIVYWITAIAYCITIIGIPIGIQLFKLGKFVLMPFGYTLEENDSGLGFGCECILVFLRGIRTIPCSPSYRAYLVYNGCRHSVRRTTF